MTMRMTLGSCYRVLSNKVERVLSNKVERVLSNKVERVQSNKVATTGLVTPFEDGHILSGISIGHINRTYQSDISIGHINRTYFGFGVE